MRLLIALGLLLAVGAAHGWIFSKPPAKEQRTADDESGGELRAKPFAAGKEFTFSYEAQIASGVQVLDADSQNAPVQKASTRLAAQVRIQMATAEKGQMQLRQLKMGTLNRHIDGAERLQPWSFYDARPLGQQELRQLQAPVEFVLRDGLVTELAFPQTEKAYSRNWKKAILNMMQLNLKEASVGSGRQEPQLLSFSAPETTLEGACQVTYSLSQQHDGMNVSKSVDFQRCNQTADVTFGFDSMEAQIKCSECAKKAHNSGNKQQQKQQKEALKQCLRSCDAKKIPEAVLERSTTLQYALTGGPTSYGIQRVLLTSEYIFREPGAPHDASQQSIGGGASVMHSIAIAELLYQGAGNAPERTANAESGEKDVESLLYNNRESIAHKRYYMYGEDDDRLLNEDRSKHPFRNMPHKVEQAEQLIRKVLRETSFDRSNGIPMQAVLNVQQLTALLRKCSADEIKEIYGKFGATNGRREQSGWPDSTETQQQQQAQQGPAAKQNKKACELLDGCLASAGTYNSLRVLVGRISSQEIGAGKAALALKTLGVSAHSPSDRHVRQLLRLCQEPQLEQRGELLHQSCWLTAGALINTLCAPKSNATQQQLGDERGEVCGKANLQEYARTLTEKFKGAGTFYGRMLALKALANAGLPSTFDALAKVVQRGQEQGQQGQQHSMFVRIAAIDATHRMRYTMATEIQRLLLPIFNDASESTPVRIAAFWYLMATQPASPLVEQIVYTLRRAERSQQLYSFVYTTLWDLSEQRDPMAHELKGALQALRASVGKLRWSRSQSLPLAKQAKLNFASVFARGEVLPAYVSVGAGSPLGDCHGPSAYLPKQIRLTVGQQGVEQWYERVMQYMRVQRPNDHGDDGARDNSELVDVAAKLGITKRAASRNGPFGMALLRVGDVDQALALVEEGGLPHAVQQILRGERPSAAGFAGQNAAQFALDAALNFGERQAHVATSVGLPLTVAHSLPAMLAVEGSVERSAKGVALRVQPLAFTAAHIHSMEVGDAPLASTGVERLQSVELNAPVNAQLHFDNGAVALTLKGPRGAATSVLGVHTLPATYTRDFNAKTGMSGEPTIKAIQSERFDHLQRELKSGDASGGGFALSGHMHWPPASAHSTLSHDYAQIAQLLLATENHVQLSYHQPAAAEERRQLELTLSAEAFRKMSANELASQLTEQFANFYSSDWQDLVENDDVQTLKEGLKRKLTKIEKRDKVYRHWLKLEARTADESQGAGTGADDFSAQLLVGAECEDSLDYCHLSAKLNSTGTGAAAQWKAAFDSAFIRAEKEKSAEQIYGPTPSRRFLKEVAKYEVSWQGFGSQQQHHRLQLRVQGSAHNTNDWVKRSHYGDSGEFAQKQDAAALLNKWSAKLEWQLPQGGKEVRQLHHWHDAFKLAHYYNMAGAYGTARQANSIEATALINPVTQRHANLTVRSPFDAAAPITRFESIAVPYGVQLAPIVEGGAAPSKSGASHLNSMADLVQTLGVQGRAECRVEGQGRTGGQQLVSTFDEVHYSAPLSQCYTVLAKDCSAGGEGAGEPAFIVLLKENIGGGKKVKLITRQETIEAESEAPIASDSDESQSTAAAGTKPLVVKIDGQRVAYNADALQRPSNRRFAAVRFTNAAKSEVEIHTRDVTVRFDGERVSIRISPFHKNTQCGLCGHYDGDERGEFRTGANAIGDLKEFHRSYTVRGDEADEDCSAAHHDSFYQGPFWQQQAGGSSESQEPQEPREFRAAQKSVAKTRALEHDGKLCFSTERVPECPAGSYATSGDEERVEFVCLQRSSMDARRLQRSISWAKQRQQPEDGAAQEEIGALKAELAGTPGLQKIAVHVPKECSGRGR